MLAMMHMSVPERCMRVPMSGDEGPKQGQGHPDLKGGLPL